MLCLLYGRAAFPLPLHLGMSKYARLKTYPQADHLIQKASFLNHKNTQALRFSAMQLYIDSYPAVPICQDVRLELRPKFIRIRKVKDKLRRITKNDHFVLPVAELGLFPSRDVLKEQGHGLPKAFNRCVVLHGVSSMQSDLCFNKNFKVIWPLSSRVALKYH